VGSYKPYIDSGDSELHNHHKPIFVAVNVKDIMLVAHHIRIAKVLSDISQTMPIFHASHFIPPFQWNTGVSVLWLLIEEFELLM
jgi:hypothetical protein